MNITFPGTATPGHADTCGSKITPLVKTVESLHEPVSGAHVRLHVSVWRERGASVSPVTKQRNSDESSGCVWSVFPSIHHSNTTLRGPPLPGHAHYVPLTWSVCIAMVAHRHRSMRWGKKKFEAFLDFKNTAVAAETAPPSGGANDRGLFV